MATAIGVYGHELKGEKLEAFHVMADALTRRDYMWRYGPEVLAAPSDQWSGWCTSDYSYLGEVDYVITLGGDGTILRAVSRIGDRETPVIGFNLGRMGFLAAMDMHQLEEVLDAIDEDSYTISSRSMLWLEASRPVFSDAPFALNDITLLKRDTSSMITITTYVDGDFLTSYWADGLIVSTPTGSTGYSLSCGGPIIMPHSDNVVLTPVAPHNLNMRPIILSDAAEISFEIGSRSDMVMCSMDSRFEVIDSQIKLTVKKCPFAARLLQLKGYSYLANIRQKLAWGHDARN